MMVEALHIGIDLGTTNCSVAFFHRYTHKVEVKRIDVGDSPEVIRSILSKDLHGNWVVGNQAAALNQWQERSVFSIKTQLRKNMNYTLTVDDTTYNIEDLIAILLEQLLLKAGVTDNRKIQRLCLSVPVQLQEEQKQLMERAAMRLGLAKANIWFIDEPVSVLWDCRSIAGQYVLIFDFGGGTLDVAIMDKYETEERQVELAQQTRYKGKVLAKVGMDIGGDDIDDVMIRAMIEEGQKQGNPVCNSINLSLFDDPARLDKLKNHEKFNFYQQLKAEAERLKHRLSKQEQVTLDIAPLIAGVDEGIKRFTMTLEELTIRTSAIRSRMLQGLSALNHQFQQQTGKSHQHIEAVLLSGGSSLLPFVPDLLEELYVNARIVWDEGFLQTRIARGNARYTQSDTDVLIGDPVHASYGIYNHAGKETIVVIEDTEHYPLQKVKRVATTKENQQSIEIVPMVKQAGQSQFAHFQRDGKPLRLRMNIQPHPQTLDLSRISITYEIDKSQRLRIYAYDHLFQSEIGIEEIWLDQLQK